jgi:hypothetical protein
VTSLAHWLIGGYQSFIEWTCPQDGTYYVMVRGYGPSDIGTFNIVITDSSAAGGANLHFKSQRRRWKVSASSAPSQTCDP